ncbi:MBL fold metallo-hydrolase [bacterium]|nr:MBL fold metallo-hydrolase [bacterium]
MKKTIIFIAAVAVILFVTGWVAVAHYPEKLLPLLIRNQLERNFGDPVLQSENDNIVVITVGTGTPMPGKRAQTGIAVLVNGYFFMFDAGDGIVQRAESIGLPLDELDGVFITHWHSDHYMDLPGIISRSWILGRNGNLHLYAPLGLDSIIKATDKFLGADNQYRADHHGTEVMDISKSYAISHEFSIKQGETEVVFNQDGIKITAFDVNHEPVEPAVGYSIEYMGKKVVLSGDTRKNDLVQEVALNADLLIHEVMLMSVYRELAKALEKADMARNEKIVTDMQEYHTSPSEVADLARAANVKILVLNHLAPAPDNLIIKRLYMNELKAFDGPIHLANDGDIFVVK